MRAPRFNPALLAQCEPAPVLSESKLAEIAAHARKASRRIMDNSWRERNGLAPLSAEDYERQPLRSGQNRYGR